MKGRYHMETNIKRNYLKQLRQIRKTARRNNKEQKGLLFASVSRTLLCIAMSMLVTPSLIRILTEMQEGQGFSPSWQLTLLALVYISIYVFITTILNGMIIFRKSRKETLLDMSIRGYVWVTTPLVVIPRKITAWILGVFSFLIPMAFTSNETTISIVGTIILAIFIFIVNAYYSLAPTYGIAYDESGNASIKATRKLLKTHYTQLMILMFSFIGWDILSVITFGLTSVYSYPYKQATLNEFRKELENENISRWRI